PLGCATRGSFRDAMAPRAPAPAADERLRELRDRSLEVGREGVVPAVPEAEQADGRHHLDDLLLVEMRAQRFEMRGTDAVRRLAHREGEAQGGALGVVEERRRLELPDGRDARRIDARLL